jgi:poly-gamma-glutamate capsule biosynthesis protein CapA/YwtB (metallophosphatase superfamily)
MTKQIKALFTGDIAFVGAAESSANKKYELSISKDIFRIFQNADISVVNLESPLTASGTKISKTGPHLRANPFSIKLLNDLGIASACLSNNHIRDYGNQGVVDTIRTCNANGIKTVGAGNNLDDASAPIVFEVESKRIAILNFSESEFNHATKSRAGSNPDDPIHIYDCITHVKNKADYIFVVMHGGKEMYPYPTPYQQKLYRHIIELGASSVIGHHSHVLGGYEYYKEKPIIYSLGNFIFDEPGNPSGWYTGAVAEFIFTGSKIDLNFYKIVLDKDSLNLSETQNASCINEKAGFMHEIDDDLVKKKWIEFIDQIHLYSLSGVLNYNLYKRAMLKLRIIKVSARDNQFLLRLGNKMRCSTHRLELLDFIEKYTKE